LTEPDKYKHIPANTNDLGTFRTPDKTFSSRQLFIKHPISSDHVPDTPSPNTLSGKLSS